MYRCIRPYDYGSFGGWDRDDRLPNNTKDKLRTFNNRHFYFQFQNGTPLLFINHDLRPEPDVRSPKPPINKEKMKRILIYCTLAILLSSCGSFPFIYKDITKQLPPLEDTAKVMVYDMGDTIPEKAMTGLSYFFASSAIPAGAFPRLGKQKHFLKEMPLSVLLNVTAKT